jgi:hypothetical protein
MTTIFVPFFGMVHAEAGKYLLAFRKIPGVSPDFPAGSAIVRASRGGGRFGEKRAEEA